MSNRSLLTELKCNNSNIFYKQNAPLELNKKAIGITRNDINVYPNPASSKIIVEYNLLESIENGKITLSSLDGESVKSLSINRQYGIKEMDISNSKPGVYLLSLCNKGVKVNSKKITIIR